MCAVSTPPVPAARRRVAESPGRVSPEVPDCHHRRVDEPRVSFQATVEPARKTATGIEVPPDVLEQLGAGKRPAVTVDLGTHTYRTTVGTMGGRHLIPVSAEVRAASGVAAGDVLTVTLTLDTAPRVVEVPADLAEALADVPTAQAAFAALSYSGQRAHVLSVEGAKTPATRTSRIAKVLAALT